MGNTTTIKIEMKNNSFARDIHAVRALFPQFVAARHNGGKVVIATVATADVASVCDAMDDARQVVAYDVRAEAV